jgi:UPF0716 protein FxsA
MPWFIAVALLVVPLIEIYVIVQVGQAIGAWWTILLLVVESALGAWLVKREGKRAWRALRKALETGKMPSRELADAALLLIGGTLLLTPGFVTDVFGFFFVLPFTRGLARKALTAFVTNRLMLSIGTPVNGFNAKAYRPGRPKGPEKGSEDPPRTVVVEGEVLDPAKQDPETPPREG